jgi:predicted AAA+ superfamily ATPase
MIKRGENHVFAIYLHYMKRDIYDKLLLWKHDKYRKPLVLRGARQVGKTYILSAFAKEYPHSLYINFEEMPEIIPIFADNLSPSNIINQLQIKFGTSIEPANTLLIFDEIQECPEALNSLKYFNEKANEYHVVSAGSLLGVKLNRTKGFPVGKVDFLDLKPLSFFEFLDAMGEDRLRKLFASIDEFELISETLHQQAIALLKQYFIVGGMPEAVKIYAKEKDFTQARKVQKSIAEAYALDFAKHATATEVMKIMAIWDSIANQLAKENKKFIFSALKKSARAREYETAIQWLVDAGLIYKSFNISTPKIPVANYANKNIYKIYMLDVGLLGYMSRLPIDIMVREHQLFVEFKGALTENFVAQELISSRFDKLYYWSSEGQAEVDFVLPYELEVYPLEVKAGISTRKKSLLAYGEKYQTKILSRATLMNLKKNGVICNYPLYLVSLFPILQK